VEWSTITEATRGQGTKKKTCFFCDYEYAGGPAHIRTHLDPTIKPRHVSSPLPSRTA
jgi:hypothetical protein